MRKCIHKGGDTYYWINKSNMGNTSWFTVEYQEDGTEHEINFNQLPDSVQAKVYEAIAYEWE